MSLGKDAKKVATLHEVGILVERKPATDEYAMLVHSDDLVLRGNAGNTIGYDKSSVFHCSNVGNAICYDERSALHYEPPKQKVAPLNSDAIEARLAGWGCFYVP